MCLAKPFLPKIALIIGDLCSSSFLLTERPISHVKKGIASSSRESTTISGRFHFLILDRLAARCPAPARQTDRLTNRQPDRQITRVATVESTLHLVISPTSYLELPAAQIVSHMASRLACLLYQHLPQTASWSCSDLLCPCAWERSPMQKQQCLENTDCGTDIVGLVPPHRTERKGSVSWVSRADRFF